MEEESKHGEMLPAIGVLSEISDEIRGRLAAAGSFISLPEGKYLAIQGKPLEHLSLILSGLVTVKTHAHGDTVELARLTPGHFVGEMSALDPRPASANARTSEETRVWQISCTDFWAFLESDHEIGFTLMKVLAKELCGRIRMDTERSLREADRRHTDSYRADY